jgi:hypothetical protein
LKKSWTIALGGRWRMTSRIFRAVGVPSAIGDWRLAVSVRTGISNVVGSTLTILHGQGANRVDDPALRATWKAFDAGDPGERTFATRDGGGSGGSGVPRSGPKKAKIIA